MVAHFPVTLRACLHEGGGGKLLRWGNPPVHIISHFSLITFTEMRGDQPRRVARSASQPRSILPCKHFKVPA